MDSRVASRRDERVLLTHRALFAIGGSELTVLDLAKHFVTRGARVMVFTHGFSAWWTDLLKDLGVETVESAADEAGRKVLEFGPTLVWACHSLVPPELVSEPGNARFIFLHLSSFERLEFVRFPRVEAALASAVLFIAEEARRAQLRTGLLRDVAPERLGLWTNPIPDAYALTSRVETTLHRLLIVSNHVANELAEALSELRRRYEVRILGAQAEFGAVARLIDPSDLEWCDAVLTIGRTVQMGLLAARPVFCYDVHGGPGWITEENFSRAREFNFSGRGFGRLGPGDIVTALSDGYGAASAWAASTQQEHLEHYRLSTAVDNLLAGMAQGPKHVEVEELEILSYRLAQEIEHGYINAVEARNRTVDYLRGMISASAG